MSVSGKKILGCAAFVLCLLVLQGFSRTLELDRQQVLSGEIWRIWTGHLVHTNLHHLVLNTVAALLIYFAFFTKIKFGSLLVCGALFTPFISMALLFIDPGLDWYNGLSGLLHAFVAFFSIHMIRNGSGLYCLGLCGVWTKVLIETIRSSLGYEYLIGDMNVIGDAHLIGAFVGTLAGIIVMMVWHASFGAPQRPAKTCTSNSAAALPSM